MKIAEKLKACRVSYGSARIQFSLPQWTSEPRFEYSVPHYYPQGHAWAGSYDRTTCHNRLSDALLEAGAKETCLHPFGQWVEFETEVVPTMLDITVSHFQKTLERVLHAWVDYQPEEA